MTNTETFGIFCAIVVLFWVAKTLIDVLQDAKKQNALEYGIENVMKEFDA